MQLIKASFCRGSMSSKLQVLNAPDDAVCLAGVYSDSFGLCKKRYFEHACVLLREEASMIMRGLRGFKGKWCLYVMIDN